MAAFGCPPRQRAPSAKTTAFRNQEFISGAANRGAMMGPSPYVVPTASAHFSSSWSRSMIPLCLAVGTQAVKQIPAARRAHRYFVGGDSSSGLTIGSHCPSRGFRQ
jgi:hypothetical protein